MTGNNWNELSIVSKKFTKDKARRIIELYNACQRNDISSVSKCLSIMTIEEMNYRNPFDGNTILHEVTKLGYIDIIRLLLDNVIYPIRNKDGKTPCDLAQTDSLRQTFRRLPPDFRFSFNPQNGSKSKTNIKCKSCSMINDQSSYEWELVDDLAYQNALRLRHELEPYRSKNFLKKAIFSFNKGYLKINPIQSKEIKSIRKCFKDAFEEEDPFHILTAYTICQKFTNQLNMDMARNVMHDLKHGCSLFSCSCLYSTQDATQSITSILLYHPQFDSLNYTGRVYRGLRIQQSLFKHYTRQSRIITTTFLSTSKNRQIAEIFSSPDNLIDDKISVVCIYEIKNQNRTAIEITSHSRFQNEDEVLILPYSSFDIINIEKNDEKKQTEIYLEECNAT